jgi:hypothetical protein
VLEQPMDWWSLAPYWIPAIVAVVAILILAAAARSRAARRSARSRRAPSSSVDAFYLDSSHIGEPQAEDRPDRLKAFAARIASGRKRHAHR